MNITVNMSDARVSCQSGDVLVTYSLGSCIGVAVYDPEAKAGGMLHYQLPTSSIDPDRARQNPLMFADTGMAVLLDKMASLGCRKNRLKVKLAGAAQILNDASLFNIGKRNHAAIRKILWQSGILVEAEDVGGSSPRNLYLDVASGQVMVKCGQRSIPL